MNPDNEEDLWLVDQLNKCRCCFEKFNNNEDQVKITEIIEKQFLEVTQIELKSSPSYSNKVCMKCTNELSSISSFRLNLISKQKQLYHNITSQYLTQDVIKFESVDVKIETQSSDESENLFNVETQYEEIEKTEVPVISEATKANDQQLATNSYSMNLQKPKELKVKTKGQKKLLNRVKKIEAITTMCPHCGITVLRSHSLSQHIRRVHLKERNFFCDLCEFSSIFKSDIVIHMPTHVPLEFREKLHCSKCEFVTISNQGMKLHVKSNSCNEIKKKVEIPCYCGKVFSSKQGFNFHIKYTHQKQRNHVCTICEKAFVSPSKLKIHMASHSGKRDIPCEVCGKLFMSLTHLRMHSKYHKVQEFSCNFDGCTKKFFKRTTFESHKKTHTDQRDFACHLCDKKYFLANHLNRHVLHFHKQLKVNCELLGCSSKFARKETYRNHVLSHHKDLSEGQKQSLLLKIREMKQV